MGIIGATTTPIKSIQRGYISSASLTAGSGEDAEYVDVTISSVNVAKSVVHIMGAAAAGSLPASYNTGGGQATAPLFARLTSATNLRISIVNTDPNNLQARWTVVEYA